MALAIATVCDSISGLSVSGAEIRDLDQIPEQADFRQAVIIPRPDGFVSNLRVVRDSQGSNSTVLARYTIRYRLTYRLLYAPIGSGRGLFDKYPDMIAKAFLFLDAILANDLIRGAVDIAPAEISAVGPVSDPSGKVYHGCDIPIDVTEFVN